MVRTPLLLVLTSIVLFCAACTVPQPIGDLIPATPTIEATSTAPAPTDTPTATPDPTLVLSSTMTPTQPSTSPVNAPLTPFPVVGLACGALTVQSKPTRTTTPHATLMENCFAQAFQQCRVATLIVTVNGPDDVGLHTFTTDKQKTRCAVVDSVQHYFFRDKHTTKHIYTCDDFAQRTDGLIFVSCGDEYDIVVPKGAS